MKRIIINVILIITIFIIYLLQSNFFNWFTIVGIMPNMFIILILFIGLFANKIMGTIYGIILGLLLDLIIGTKIGIYAICFGLIGFLAGTFDKNFSKDSRMTIMLMVFSSTVIFELARYLLNYFFININIEIINFIKITLIEVIYNLILTIIVYPLIQRFGYYIENEYKGNKILTRYF